MLLHIFNCFQLEMEITAGSDQVIMLQLHDSNQNVPYVTDTFGNAVFILPAAEHGIKLLTDLAVDTVKTLKLSTNSLPCKSDLDHSLKTGLFDCLEDYFEQNNGCILPWKLQEETEYHSKNCSNVEDFKDLLGAIIDRPFYSHIYNVTKCKPFCEQLVKEIHHPILLVQQVSLDFLLQRYSYKKPFELKVPRKANDPSFNLRIYMSPNGVFSKKEVLVFDALEMIGNIGGYLGMLLGWSILSFFTAGCQKISARAIV